eukprot:scpid69450/ scgid20506/ 
MAVGNWTAAFYVVKRCRLAPTAHYRDANTATSHPPAMCSCHVLLLLLDVLVQDFESTFYYEDVCVKYIANDIVMIITSYAASKFISSWTADEQSSVHCLYVSWLRCSDC